MHNTISHLRFHVIVFNYEAKPEINVRQLIGFVQIGVFKISGWAPAVKEFVNRKFLISEMNTYID